MAFNDPWDIPEPVRAELTIDTLRPWALRVLFHLLSDSETPARIRLDAAKLVVERSKERDAEGAQGSDAVIDIEAERLYRELQKHA